MSAPVWFFRVNQQQQGPVALEQLVEEARAGRLAPTDLVWQAGTPSWIPASTVAALVFPTAALAFPPPPPVTAPRPTSPIWPAIKFHLARAAEWDLRHVKVSAEEERELLDVGVDDSAARSYHAWRRSILLLVTVAATATALAGLVSAGTDDHKGLNDFGKMIEGVRALSLFVMPIYAWRAAKVWTRHKTSRRYVLIGWTFAFLAPLILELAPMHWRYDLAQLGPGVDERVVRLLGAMSDYVTLMPAVLALIPGVLRACLRVKVLLPQSMLPGWFLVAVAPLWMFLFLVIFATINQLASDPILIIGVVTVAVAPMLYVRHAAVFTRPLPAVAAGNTLSGGGELKQLLQVQKYVRLILTAGVIFLLIWFVSGKLLGVPIVAIEGQALVRPWSADLIKFPLEFGSHSLFTMTLVADLMMAMNLTIWNHTKGFMGTPAAAEYDKTMSEVEEAGARE